MGKLWGGEALLESYVVGEALRADRLASLSVCSPCLMLVVEEALSYVPSPAAVPFCHGELWNHEPIEIPHDLLFTMVFLSQQQESNSYRVRPSQLC